jgi:hypothetical protein
MSVDVFNLLISKSGGATLKVMPPFGGPHEHAGPLPGILGGPAGSPVRSTTSLPLLFGLLACVAPDLNLADALVLVAKPRVPCFLL